MTGHKRVNDEFNWIPMDKRIDKLGLPVPPRAPELRKPVFWLIRVVVMVVLDSSAPGCR